MSAPHASQARSRSHQGRYGESDEENTHQARIPQEVTPSVFNAFGARRLNARDPWRTRRTASARKLRRAFRCITAAKKRGELLSRGHRFGARGEASVARVMGTTRKKYRGRYESAADMAPVVLDNGATLIVESKARAALPQWILKALEQAKRYLPSAVPVVALTQAGGCQLVVLDLREFCALVGLRELPRQLSLPLGGA